MQRVCCVMLANGREAMVRRAITSFKAQTYPLELRTLLIWNSGAFLNLPPEADQHIFQSLANQEPKRTIGALRNEANQATGAFVPGQADVICHWDSDDWSHPNRIAEQTSLLQTSGKQCVGYRNMLFWDEPRVYVEVGRELERHVGSAWIYMNHDHSYCIGTSLCYRREAWQRRPFPNLPKLGKERGGEGEELEWLREVDSLGAPSIFLTKPLDYLQGTEQQAVGEPRMIASIHGGNSQDYSRIERSDSWRRTPQWDLYCQERMTL